MLTRVLPISVKLSSTWQSLFRQCLGSPASYGQMSSSQNYCRHSAPCCIVLLTMAPAARSSNHPIQICISYNRRVILESMKRRLCIPSSANHGWWTHHSWSTSRLSQPLFSLIITTMLRKRRAIWTLSIPLKPLLPMRACRGGG